MDIVMTGGILPSREVFEKQFGKHCPEGKFRFGNDPFVGTCELTCDELWDELNYFTELFGDKDEDVYSWCSSVLCCLSIEWV